MTTQPDSMDDPIRDAVRVLAAYRNRTQAEVILGAGIPKSTFIRRMQHGGWTVTEVRALAAFLGVDPLALLDGADQLFRPERVRTGGSAYRAPTVGFPETGEDSHLLYAGGNRTPVSRHAEYAALAA